VKPAADATRATAAQIVINRNLFISAYFFLWNSIRTPRVGSQLQPFFHALVYQDFDIDASVEFTAYGVRIVRKTMRAAIADGHENAPHWDVLNMVKITGYSGSAFLAQLLISLSALCVGGVSRDLDQIPVKGRREFGKIGEGRLSFLLQDG